MFPRTFEHDGEHQIAPMPTDTWYESTLRKRREFAAECSPMLMLDHQEIWHCDDVGLTFDVAYAKELVQGAPRLPHFLATNLFDENKLTSRYQNTIYKLREDEWPWVRLHVPCLLLKHQDRWFLLDGNHRLAKARRLGLPFFLGYVLSEAEADAVRVRDVATWKFHGTRGPGNAPSEWITNAVAAAWEVQP